MIKISKYSIKSEAAIHGCTIKKLFSGVLKVPQRKTYAWASFKIRLQAYILIFFKKKRLCASVFKCFRVPFLQNTSGCLLLQNTLLFSTSTSATKCYHWSCFLLFNLKLVYAIFHQIFVFSPDDSPLKTMKNVFDFI